MNRRRLLRAAGVGLAGVAGCGERRESATTTRSTTTAGLPYGGDGDGTLAEPHGIVVHNRGDETGFVTVAVYDGDQAVLSRTFEVTAGARVAVSEALAAPGAYRVVVETAAGARATHEWRVTADGGDLEVVVDGELRFREVMECAPSCPALGEGTGGPLPYKAATTEREPAVLVVENDGREPREVGVMVADLHGTILDYGYEVPARTRLRIPVTGATGVYAVSVRAGGERREYDWHVPEVQRLRVRVGGDLRVDCGDATGSLRLVNRDDRAHELTVRVRDDDGVVFERTVRVAAGGEHEIPDAVASSGRHRIEASTAEGASATGDWWVCPPVARRLVQVHKWGGVVIGSTGLS